MNRLNLNRVRDQWDDLRLQVCIDGQPFEQIFNQHQEGTGYKLCLGTCPPYKLLGDLADDLADPELRIDLRDRVDGFKELSFHFDGRRFYEPLLLCTCGDDECWSVWCAVEIQDRLVTWSDFKSGRFRQDDARPLDIEFEFDREQYLAEFTRFCCGAAWPDYEIARVLDAGFSHTGCDFIVATSGLNHVWSLTDGSYWQARTLLGVDYQRRGEAAYQDDGELFLSGPTDPGGLWCARVHDDTTVRIVSTRTDELLIELRFDAVNVRWLALDSRGLFDIHGRLSYPVTLPTIFGGLIRKRGLESLRKGLLAATLAVDQYRRPGSGEAVH